MSDYRVTMRVRNARILNAIEKAGHKPGMPFATLIGLKYKYLLEYINCKRVPFDEDFNLRPCAEKLCIFFNKLPNELWSNKQLVPLQKNIIDRDVDDIAIDSILSDQSHVPSLLENMEREEELKSLNEVLDTLSPRESEILRMHYGFDCEEKSFKDLSELHEISTARIMQIERVALRKLRHPSRSTILKESKAYQCYTEMSVLDKLFDIQSRLYHGRGLLCIRKIHEFLKKKQLNSARLMISTNWDMIVQYPEICELLNMYWNNGPLLEPDRHVSLYSSDEEAKLTATVNVMIYDKLITIIRNMFESMPLDKVFDFANIAKNAIISPDGYSIEVRVFKSRINEMALKDNQLAELVEAINGIVKDAKVMLENQQKLNYVRLNGLKSN